MTWSQPVHLRHPLPDDIDWLEGKVLELFKPAALATECNQPTKPGGTFTHGLPDIPSDANWPTAVMEAAGFLQHIRDGLTHWLQLNLEDIPEAVRRPDMPSVGVVWLFVDLSGNWTSETVFDPRPAKSIPWAPRHDARPTGVSFELVDSLPQSFEELFPELAGDYSEGSFSDQFDKWVFSKYSARPRNGFQLLGWHHPIQGDGLRRNETFVAGFERQEFGDSGAVYLHYSAEKGFFAYVECS